VNQGRIVGPRPRDRQGLVELGDPAGGLPRSKILISRSGLRQGQTRGESDKMGYNFWDCPRGNVSQDGNIVAESPNTPRSSAVRSAGWM